MTYFAIATKVGKVEKNTHICECKTLGARIMAIPDKVEPNIQESERTSQAH